MAALADPSGRPNPIGRQRYRRARGPIENSVEHAPVSKPGGAAIVIREAGLLERHRRHGHARLPDAPAWSAPRVRAAVPPKLTVP